MSTASFDSSTTTLRISLITSFARIYDGIIGVPQRILFWGLVLTVVFKLVALGLGQHFVDAPPDYLSHHDSPLEILSVYASYEEQLIAKYGYLLDLPQKRLIAKPPLFALLTRGIMGVTGLPASTAVFVAHSVSVFFSLIWVYRFAELLFGDRLAFRMMLLFPFSLAGSGHIYLLSFHEPLTITLVMAIFYHLQKRQDMWVAILTAFFALSRSQVFGLILIFVLVALREGWILWRSKDERDTSRLPIIKAMLNRILLLCALPTIAFLMWQIAASLHTGWQFAPMYAQRFYAHGFGWYKPYELIGSFVALLNPQLRPEWIPFHLTRCAMIIVVFISLGYMVREARQNSLLMPAVLYAVLLMFILAFVGLNDMPRLLHATVMPFAVPIMLYKVGQRLGRFHEIGWGLVYTALSIAMLGIVLHNFYVESLGIIM